MKKTKLSPGIFIDPVCLKEVESCRKAFEANPDNYLEAKPKKRKGWWGRYLERLNKATGGTPPKCCH